ncbi:MAG: metal ABC transporter permease, partial [Phycisphaerales bacterium]|nr:metal ABC transporter permease [Phycisphaerales bacterium]
FMMTRAAGAADGAAWPRFIRTVTLHDHNTRVVLFGTCVLGVAAGVMGTYMVLRRRSLIGDALSHATLPGIAIAFMVMTALGGSGKWLPGLLIGAATTGLLAVGLILLLQRVPRVRPDTALGLVLSVMFGAGFVLLGLIQKMPTGNQAGLEHFVMGTTAAMLSADALAIAAAAAAVVVTCVLLFKEFTLLSFDPAYARAQGWPVGVLDVMMMLLVTLVIVIGLQAVGIILIISLLIIPPASARFWTHGLRATLVIAASIGGASGLLGAAVSAVLPHVPAGAVIVLVAASMFVVSLFFGVRRGILARIIEHHRTARRIHRHHLLRAVYEWLESAGRLDDAVTTPMPTASLETARAWAPGERPAALRRARRDGLITRDEVDAVRLTDAGLDAARRIVRKHRLWELFLITHADVAPSHVDRDADTIEHILDPAMTAQLEAMLDARILDAEALGARTRAAGTPPIPPSPHVLSTADRRPADAS